MGRLERRRDLEEHILKVSRKTLVTSGLDGFVLRAIAESCGMRLGNLQYYFATRDDLLEALLRAELAADLEAMTALSSDCSVSDFVRQIQVVVDRWATTEQSVYIPIGVLSLTNSKLRAAWIEIYEVFYTAMAELVRRIDPTVSPDLARVRAIKITALIDGASVQPYEAWDPVDKELLAAELVTDALGMARGDAPTAKQIDGNST